MKKCTKCREIKHLYEFNKDSAKKDGLRSSCKVCIKIYRDNTIQYQKDYQKLYKTVYPIEKVRSSVKKWADKNKGKIKSRNIKWRKLNPEYQSTYSKNNRSIFNRIGAKRRASKLNATPEWSEYHKIKILYEKAKWLESLTGLKYHVDHIVPLNNDNVCGLHVWANLQLLEASINIEKSNKLQ